MATSLCPYISLHCDFLCFFFSKSLCQHHQSLSLHWDHRDMKHAFYNIETCLKSMPRLLVQHPNSISVSLFVLAWWNTWWCFCRRRKGEDEEWWGLMLRSLAHHPSYRRGREGGKEHDKSNEQELTDPKKKKKNSNPKSLLWQYSRIPNKNMMHPLRVFVRHSLSVIQCFKLVIKFNIHPSALATDKLKFFLQHKKIINCSCWQYAFHH